MFWRFRRFKTYLGIWIVILFLIFNIILDSSYEKHDIDAKIFFTNSSREIALRKRNASLPHSGKNANNTIASASKIKKEDKIKDIEAEDVEQQKKLYYETLKKLQQKKSEIELQRKQIDFEMLNLLKNLKNSKELPSPAALPKTVAPKNIPKPKPQPKPTKKTPQRSQLSHEIDKYESSFNESQIRDISNKIYELNKKQQIYNSITYGNKSLDIVIIVQVSQKLRTFTYVHNSEHLGDFF